MSLDHSIKKSDHKILMETTTRNKLNSHQLIIVK